MYLLSLNYAVVTNNERHFRRIPGLRIENWTK
jgi:predicted nucleic acid-binding protein